MKIKKQKAVVSPLSIIPEYGQINSIKIHRETTRPTNTFKGRLTVRTPEDEKKILHAMETKR